MALLAVHHQFQSLLDVSANARHHPFGRLRRPYVLERIGRLRQKYPRAAQYYVIDVAHDPESGLATAVTWTRQTPIDDTLPSVDCLVEAANFERKMREI